jgi:hypothetical protein
MDENPKLWVGTPGKDDWTAVGDVIDFEMTPASDSHEDGLTADFVGDMLRDKTITVTTQLQPSMRDTMLEMMKKIGPFTDAMEQFYRSVMVFGTRSVAHRHPGSRVGPSGSNVVWSDGSTSVMTRVDHARARRLYSERLRRDRRRIRKGRKPILRTGPSFKALFPRAQVSTRQVPGGYLGLDVIASPALDTGQVVVMDTGALGQAAREFVHPPKFSEPEPGGWRGHGASRWVYDEPYNWKGTTP